MSFIYIELEAGSFGYPVANPAPLDRDVFTNGTKLRQLFDDTIEEFIERTIPEIPDNIDGAGTVTFIAKGYAKTAAASKNIKLRLGHSAVLAGETFDKAYTDEDSGDLATDSTQDNMDRLTWTETVSNLTWIAGEEIRLQLSRIAPGANNLVGDYGLTSFTLKIPVT